MAMSELKRTENSVLEGKEDVRIGVHRHFTLPGSDPFDSVEMELLTALIPGKDGPWFGGGTWSSPPSGAGRPPTSSPRSTAAESSTPPSASAPSAR